MAQFVQCSLDFKDEKIIIVANSSRYSKCNDNSYHYRFNRIFIDYSSTFNCINEPSSHAQVITIPETQKPGMDEMLTFEIPFSDLLVNDIRNELFFIYLEEEVYKENREYSDEYTSKIISYSIDAGWGDPTDEHNEEARRLIQEGIDVSLFDKNDVFVKTISYTLCDMEYSVFVLFSICDLLDLLLKSIDIEDENKCEASCSDVNIMLAWDGFQIASCYNDIKSMIKFWNIIHSFDNMTVTSKCKCNG